jgi:hypothetical protein
MGRGGDQTARAAANGKKIGRPAKAKVPLDDGPAKKGIATGILAMDGPPEHIRACPCAICKSYPKNCECFSQCGDCQKLKENCDCDKHRPVTIKCQICCTVEDHKICHCEVCGWWEALLSRDSRLRKETRCYLTDRRDGKPAQGVFLGDTREGAQALERGNRSYFETQAAHSAGVNKPN